MKLLLDFRADVHWKTEMGKTALHYATSHQTTILLEAGADIGVKSHCGVLAIHQCPADAIEAFLNTKCSDRKDTQEVQPGSLQLKFDHSFLVPSYDGTFKIVPETRVLKIIKIL